MSETGYAVPPSPPPTTTPGEPIAAEDRAPGQIKLVYDRLCRVIRDGHAEMSNLEEAIGPVLAPHGQSELKPSDPDRDPACPFASALEGEVHRLEALVQRIYEARQAVQL